MTAPFIPMTEWGKDHWSTFAYIETCVVDRHGFVDSRRMRSTDERYPTRLRGFAQDPSRVVAGHSDWDCVADMIAAGLVAPAPGTTGEKGRLPFHEYEARARRFKTASARNEAHQFALTEAGIAMAARLREHKARGGNFAGFNPFSA